MPEANVLPMSRNNPTGVRPTNSHAKEKAAYTQAKELQALIMEDAGVYLERRDETDDQGRPLARSSDLAMMARAWCDLEETKRKLKMRPLPKPVDVSHKKAKSRPTGPAFTEE